MKIYKTISLLMIAAIAVVSFSSCTVRYHSGHRQRYHRDYNYMPAINNGTQTVSVKPASLHNLPVAN